MALSDDTRADLAREQRVLTGLVTALEQAKRGLQANTATRLADLDRQLAPLRQQLDGINAALIVPTPPGMTSM